MYYFLASMALISAAFLTFVILWYKKRNSINQRLSVLLLLLLFGGSITLTYILYPYCLTLQHRVDDVKLPFVVDQKIVPDEYVDDFREICTIVQQHYSLAQLKGIDLDCLNQTYLEKVSKATRNKEYYQLVSKYFASLKNFHTTLLYNPYYILARAQWRKGHLYVTGNVSNYPLQKGDRILSINGMNVQVWQDSIIKYVPASTDRARQLSTANFVFHNPIDSVQQLCVSRCDSVFHVTVYLSRNKEKAIKSGSKNHQKPKEIKQAKEQNKKIKMLQLMDFSDSSTSKFLTDYEKYKDCRCLIIDLSCNRGGFGRNAEKIASLFLKQPYQGKRLIKPVSTPFQGNLYVLVTHETCSAAEYLACILQESGTATLVGEETAGDFGTYCETFQTSHGTCFTLGIGIPPLTVNGNRTEGTGVKPHHSITIRMDEPIRETALREALFIQLKKEIDKKKQEI